MTKWPSIDVLPPRTLCLKTTAPTVAPVPSCHTNKKKRIYKKTKFNNWNNLEASVCNYNFVFRGGSHFLWSILDFLFNNLSVSKRIWSLYICSLLFLNLCHLKLAALRILLLLTRHLPRDRMVILLNYLFVLLVRSKTGCSPSYTVYTVAINFTTSPLHTLMFSSTTTSSSCVLQITVDRGEGVSNTHVIYIII